MHYMNLYATAVELQQKERRTTQIRELINIINKKAQMKQKNIFKMIVSL